MIRKQLNYYLAHLGQDIPAGLVVFLVALPLCLGIALASGAPLLSGIVAGIVGGLVVSWASGSQVSVSGPAAGLTVIVMAAIEQLGGFQVLLLSVVLAGAMQAVLGFAKAGTIGAYFPSSVIKGMLAAIGIILILKQIPHAVGYDADFVGDEAYLQLDSQTTLSEIAVALKAISPGAIIVSTVSILIMLLWETPAIRKLAWLRFIPGPLVAVLWGLAFNQLAPEISPTLAIAAHHLVSLPSIDNLDGFIHQLTFPDYSRISDPQVWVVAGTLAVVASLETLLSLEAVDKLDPLRRVAPTNRELKAQGLGNILSGMLGGLPLTAVIVRGSANINAGAHTKVSCFLHGILLLVSVLFIARVLNMIPLACLAAILLLTGYKLAKPKLFMELYRKGTNQIVPFVVTIIAILFTDLLKGMGIGMLCGLFYVMRANFHAALTLTRDGNNYLLRLQKDVSFLNKPLLRELLEQVEPCSSLIIDGHRAQFIDQDILETLYDYRRSAVDDNIALELRGLETAAVPRRRKVTSAPAGWNPRQLPVVLSITTGAAATPALATPVAEHRQTSARAA
ncbi:SulP family inorganic anion transporter [Methylotetracoccus oryzae]|uniref:SulP family inorganic anion transporter n=1 Tax=Methylotetracoccus oryzae TaxID=1919059 RepID=UPI00111899EA|nr:SulP family inorganic anion transporter [Methylotetracoccus oryzae]